MIRVIAAILCLAVVSLGAVKCQTTGGLPVHTKTWWLSQQLPAGAVIKVLAPGVRPPEVESRGVRVPGTWTRKGDTYLGSHVWEWRPGHPNGQH